MGIARDTGAVRLRGLLRRAEISDPAQGDAHGHVGDHGSVDRQSENHDHAFPIGESGRPLR